MPVNSKLRDSIRTSILKNEIINWTDLYNLHPADFIDTICAAYEYDLSIWGNESILGYLITNGDLKQFEGAVSAVPNSDKQKLFSQRVNSTKANYSTNVPPRSALEWAVIKKQPDVVYWLLENAGDHFPLNEAFELSLQFNTFDIAEKIVRFAIDKKKLNTFNLNKPTFYSELQFKREKENITALSFCIERAPTIAELLLTDPNTVCDFSPKLYAVRQAACHKRHSIIKLIKQKAMQQGNNPNDIFTVSELSYAKSDTSVLEAILSGQCQPDLADGKFMEQILTPYNEKNIDAQIIVMLNSGQSDVGLNRLYTIKSQHSQETKMTPLDYAVVNKLSVAEQIVSAKQLKLNESTPALFRPINMRDENIFTKLLKTNSLGLGINTRNIKTYGSQTGSCTPLEYIVISLKDGRDPNILISMATQIIARPDFKRASNAYALFYACDAKRSDFVSTIVRHPVCTAQFLTQKFKITSKDQYSSTETTKEYSVFEYALRNSHECAIAMLRDSLAAIDLITTNALLTVVQSGNPELLKALLDHAKRFHIKDIGLRVTTPLITYSSSENPLKTEQVSPLGHAIYKVASSSQADYFKKHWQIVEQLLQSGYPLDANCDKPFLCATADKYITTNEVNVLMRCYPSTTYNKAAVQNKGITPAMLAASNCSEDVFELFIAHLNPYDRDQNENSLLWYAAMSRKLKLLDVPCEYISFKDLTPMSPENQEFSRILFHFCREFNSSVASKEEFLRRSSTLDFLLDKGFNLELALAIPQDGAPFFAKIYKEGVPYYTLWIMTHMKNKNPALLKQWLSARDSNGNTLMHPKNLPGLVNGYGYMTIEKERKGILQIITELDPSLLTLTDTLLPQAKKQTTPHGLVGPTSRPDQGIPQSNTATQIHQSFLVLGERLREADRAINDADKTQNMEQAKKLASELLAKGISPRNLHDQLLATKGDRSELPATKSYMFEMIYDKEYQDRRRFVKYALISLALSPLVIPLFLALIFAIIFWVKKSKASVQKKEMSLTEFQQEAKADGFLSLHQAVVFNKERCKSEAAFVNKFGAFSRLEGNSRITNEVCVYEAVMR